MEDYNKTLDKYVGWKIKERRKTIGLTQSELADILGLSHQQVQRYESGENTISMARALELANCLNVKLNYFSDGAPFADSAGERISTGIIYKEINRPLRILLVEDSSSDELLFRKAVSKSNIVTEIHSIQNSDQVMDFLMNHKTKYGMEAPDLIMLDIKMPRMSGIDLLKKIKTTHEYRKTPVIIFSNSVYNKDMIDAYNNHASGFIQKNSDLLEFYDEINLVLQYWSRVVVLPTYA